MNWLPQALASGAVGLLFGSILAALFDDEKSLVYWLRVIKESLWSIGRLEVLAGFHPDGWYFRHAYRLYEDALPQALVDSEAMIKSWLLEDFKSQNTEEIYLVARRWSWRKLFIRPSSVLYATLYKKPEYRCVVWGIAVDDQLGSYELAEPLWTKLKDIASEYAEEHPDKNKAGRVDYYFLSTVGDGQDDYRAFLERGVEARRLTPDLLLPDTEEWQLGNEEAGIIHAYLQTGKDVVAVRRDVEEFVYGTCYLWAFDYGGKVSDLGDLRRVIVYFRRLLRELQPSLASLHLA